MSTIKNEHEWAKYIKFFNDQNAGRLTRLGVFEPKSGSFTDYWLESGVPLTGVDLDTHGARLAVQITVGDFTHVANDAVKLAFQFTKSGEEDGIDITDADGRATILRFESPTL